MSASAIDVTRRDVKHQSITTEISRRDVSGRSTSRVTRGQSSERQAKSLTKRSNSFTRRSKSFLDNLSDSSDSTEGLSNLARGDKKSTTLSRIKKKSKEGETVVDMFLFGDERENAAKLVMSGVINFIPDPPGGLDAKGQRKTRKKQLRKLRQLLKEHQEVQTRQAYETRVQEYWKQYATWPEYWPQILEQSDEYARFQEDFRSYCTMQDSEVTKADKVVVRSFKTYVVVALTKVGVRTFPTQSNDPKVMTGITLSPGKVVVVENVVIIDDIRYLKLSPGSGNGWIFDCKDDVEVMAEITDVELGLWWYRVCCSEYVEIRQTPSYTRRSGTGMILCPKEVCVVGLRGHMYGKSTFLQLYDGRGWVFVLKSDMAVAQNANAPPLVMEECDKATLGEALAELDLDGDGRIDEKEIEQALEHGLGIAQKDGIIESGLWQYEVLSQPILCVGNTMNGVLLKPGEKINVDLRAPAHGQRATEVSSANIHIPTLVMTRVWLRLYDERGWIPKTDENGKPLVKFTGAGDAQKKKAPKHALPKEQWKYGFA